VNIYRFSFFAKCPNDDASIEYYAEIRSERMIMVERINASLPDAGFHEEIANRLVMELGGEQTITAVHQGVEITTVRR
jgi:hypothetical protein